MATRKSADCDVARLSWPRSYIIWLILVFALLASLGLSLRHLGDTPVSYQDDSATYHRLAVSLLQERSFQGFTYWGPGYPLFVAAVYAIAGQKPVAVYVAQSLLFILILAIGYNIALITFQKQSHALLTIGLAAIWPFFYQAVHQLLPEVFTAVLIAAAMWHLLKFREGLRASDVVICGLLLGFICLIKPVMLIFVPIAAAIVVIPKQHLRRQILCGALLLVSAGLFVAPWTARNYHVTRAFVPVSTGGGFNFWVGNWPGFYEKPWIWRHFPADVDRLIRGKSSVEEDKIFLKVGLRYVKEDPIRAAGIFAMKFSYSCLGGIGTNPNLTRRKGFVLYGFNMPQAALPNIPIFLLSIVGFLSMSKRARRRTSPIVALTICWLLAYIITTANHRYFVPLAIFELAFAAAGAQWILEKYGILSGKQAVITQSAVSDGCQEVI